MRRLLASAALTPIFLVPLALSGCHLVLGPEEGAQEWWTYCDHTGCYVCNVDGCRIPGGECYPGGPSDQCPSGTYCDSSTGYCRGKACSTGSDCDVGYICKDGACIAQRDPCTKHSDCGDGSYCQNGTCTHSKLCSKDEDCSTLGNFVCDSRGTCVPGNPVNKTCTSAAVCPGGMCVDGLCGSCTGDCGGGKTCEFNKHCGTGRVCLDGQCTSSCTTTTDCGSGQTCKTSVCVPNTTSTCAGESSCVTGKHCVNGNCLASCTATGTCSSAKDTCSPSITAGESTLRVCHADHKARPECKLSTDCTGGETCVDGICRTSCGTSVDCAVCPDGPVCSKGGYCMTAAEADPKCTKSSQCTSGKYCLNAQCVSL